MSVDFLAGTVRWVEGKPLQVDHQNGRKSAHREALPRRAILFALAAFPAIVALQLLPADEERKAEEGK